jgi:hypothetical protein
MALIVLVLGPANQRIVDAKEPTRAEITPEAPPSA